MSPCARFLAAVLLHMGALTMAAPTGTTTTTTITATTTTTSHHLHAYLTTVASKFAFETATATPTPIHHPIMVEMRNDPHIKMHKDGSLYSDSNTTEKKKEHTDPCIRISKNGSFKPLSQDGTNDCVN